MLVADDNQDGIWTVSGLAGAINQTLDFAYGRILIEGEVINLKISRNTWVYFDLKDEDSSLRCFGSVYSLTMPLEDGMHVVVESAPKLHAQYGFSLNIYNAQPIGEGSIKKAADITRAKLHGEGLFDESRKRPLPTMPQRIGLITSFESAAFQDFTKILSARWAGLEILLYDCLVQGLEAPNQITKAINHFNNLNVDILVITRGGGSADDLVAFDSENVVRAVAGSRTPVVVAIGHESDFTLAELAADRRASTPSNAAEIIVPEKSAYINLKRQKVNNALHSVKALSSRLSKGIRSQQERLSSSMTHYLRIQKGKLASKREVLFSLNPDLVLKRGYAVIRSGSQVLDTVHTFKVGQLIEAKLKDGKVQAQVKQISVE